MKDNNILIAEFMGGKYIDEDLIELEYFIALKILTLDADGEPEKVVSTDCFTEDELRFEMSWDWLMPVIIKIENGGLDPHELIDKALESRVIEDTYNEVVDTIKRYNNGQR
jgi:hypothetical protein